MCPLNYSSPVLKGGKRETPARKCNNTLKGKTNLFKGEDFQIDD